MSYTYLTNKECEKQIEKLCRKNPVLENALRNKINEILENPQHYKPLKHDFAGERRVHIMKSFVLKFLIDENNKTISFIFFGHHYEAYER